MGGKTNYKPFIIIMKKIPSISSEIDEEKIFKIINEDFSQLAPSYYTLMSQWLINAYKLYKGIDKFTILIYLINKDLIFYRKNGLMIDYDTFYRDKSLEIPKINISDIARDLLIPKENVRRKISELQKKGVIQRKKKRIFIERSGFIQAKTNITLNDFSILVSKFSKILKNRKITDKSFDVEQVSKSIKENFSFCWYHFYKFLFIFTNRWKTDTKVHDLETICVGLIILINTVQNRDFKNKDLNRKKYLKEIQKPDHIGMNAFSIAEITGIPRATVVRKLHFLIKNKFINIDEKKLYTFGMSMKGNQFKVISKLQDKNMKSLSKFLYRIFNQIKVINSN
ncbi:MarR family transcriptional regulator [Candidatus Pelagibacter sp.]|nr:MarR family transcriptional regulator [Candidatus Pelagibacter sp.]